MAGATVAAEFSEQRDDVFLEVRDFRDIGGGEPLSSRRRDGCCGFIGRQRCGDGCQQGGEQGGERCEGLVELHE